MSATNPFSTSFSAPKAEKRPVTHTQLTRTRTDDYGWLKDENWKKVMDDPSVLNAEIRAYLDAENTYCAQHMQDTKSLQDVLFAQMKGRIKDDDSTVPDADGPYEYAQRYRAGDQHGLYFRTPRHKAKSHDTTDVEEILLDGDALSARMKADGHPYFDIGGVQHSDNHNYLAYSVDLNGAERYLINIIDIKTQAEICPPLENTSGDFEWAQDERTLFWVERDENNRPCKVYRKNVLDKNAKAILVYTETDPGFFISVSRSDTGNYVEIVCNDHTSSETWLIPADTPEHAPVCASPRRPLQEYTLHDHKDNFYVLTNADDATDFKVMKVKQSLTDIQHWQDYIAHSAGTLILGIETYQSHMVRLERVNALPRIVIRDLSNNEEHIIDFAEEAYALGLMGGYEFDTDWVRFAYSSPTTPGQVFDYNMHTRERILRKTNEIPSGHIPDDYQTKRIEITARDGEEIPVTLIMKSGLKLDSSAPCLLYGYGSYGITIPAGFRTNILSLIDQGFVYAIAHIRGGMAKGYDWYTKGKLETKQATFDDFIDVGYGLCKLGYTSEGNIIAHGGSAGGLLVGAALNQAPQLFAGVIAAVPFVDVLNTMSDESLPLTPPEWPEWGNPLISEKDYDQILAYSPYDNVEARNYPPILITAGLTDPRVTYWEPAKWAAKLRDHQLADAPILLRTNMDAGHQGEAGRYDSLKEIAFEYAFALKVTGKMDI
ncbi:MAG: S9 family peptidase [Robiginitomaculum sp.]|nr:MAG: S9 family peptidase [Robiginitomaculum sp.]